MNRNITNKYISLVSKEKGVIHKDPGGRINIVLCYPNSYSVGMSSLGFQGIYGFLNSFGDIVCERAFFPDTEDMEIFKRSGLEIYSLESRRRLSDFDIVAFSISFENDYPNVLKMLKMARIPLKSRERNERHPIVIMGGVCAFYNPEPLAEYMDIVFIGEAEEMLAEFLQTCRLSFSRDALFKQASDIEGIYVPSFYSIEYGNHGIAGRIALSDAPLTVHKRTVRDIKNSFLRTSIITPDAEFSDMCLIEAMRGCPWSCRFCVAGHIYRPVRKKDLHTISKEIKEAEKLTHRIGLIGPSLSDYPYAEEVLAMEGVDFSITSLRASEKSARLVQTMKGHKSISIAPEAGTQRLRDAINKRISEENIIETASLILDSGISILRLYFMIGLPTETMADIDGIVNLVKTIRKKTRKGLIRLTVSTFVPKPFTPFQWHYMEPLKSIKLKLLRIKKGLAETKGVKVFHDVPKDAHMQGLFALGDRKVGKVIEEAAFEGTDVIRNGSTYLNISEYIYRQKDISEVLPWDFIETGIAKKYLWLEYQKALAG